MRETVALARKYGMLDIGLKVVVRKSFTRE